jgi:hypothetical protein
MGLPRWTTRTLRAASTRHQKDRHQSIKVLPNLAIFDATSPAAWQPRGPTECSQTECERDARRTCRASTLEGRAIKPSLGPWPPCLCSASRARSAAALRPRPSQHTRMRREGASLAIGTGCQQWQIRPAQELPMAAVTPIRSATVMVVLRAPHNARVRCCERSDQRSHELADGGRGRGR